MELQVKWVKILRCEQDLGKSLVQLVQVIEFRRQPNNLLDNTLNLKRLVELDWSSYRQLSFSVFLVRSQKFLLYILIKIK